MDLSQSEKRSKHKPVGTEGAEYQNQYNKEVCI